MALFYQPSEDTYTLLDTIRAQELKNKVIVEIGTGSATIINTLLQYNHCIATDINPYALKNAKCDAIQSNLLDNLQQTGIDVIIFNPPYLNERIVRCEQMVPCEKCLDIYSYAGGQDGNEIIWQFLKTVRTKEFYLLVIRLNKIDLDSVPGYNVRVVRQKVILGETLYILHGVRER
ncbi:putative N6-DNA-methyltransferase [Trachipleistophora hominis]|uniref:Putative N6-DNA-methyltransferase n=1 Tax=Trachipleistophora hominis TaxID=72359 RepID=L7JUR5_TRAHO|nr:putative N6-DNA-methyltransferase [Trachipleistophora hominis]